MKLVQQFKDEIAGLKTENARLEAENADLKTENARLETENERLERDVAIYKGVATAIAKDAQKTTENLHF